MHEGNYREQIGEKLTELTSNSLPESIISKYQGRGPRYTSYPTALQFHQQFSNDEFVQAVRTSPNENLSIYVHIPFCRSLCYYCGCNKIVTQNALKVSRYNEALREEVAHRSQLFQRHKVQQLHFGGGTPNYLHVDELADLVNTIKQHFNMTADCEISIELDPRLLDESYIDAVASMGFNRISLGIQDTNPEVQVAINRVQSTEKIQKLLRHARKVGIASINLDLIFGLPFQSAQNFRKTLQDVAEFDADRIALFNYAHMPEKFAAQRKIKSSWLPAADTKLELLQMAEKALEEDGYLQIGMDHFARPDDTLIKARNSRQLGRNFQGYTACKGLDLLGLGLTAISHINNVYSQNCKSLSDYEHAVDTCKHAVERGLWLSKEDQLRAHVISELMCNMYVDKKAVEALFNIHFDQYFDRELSTLASFEEDGLLHDQQDHIQVYEKAKILLRSVCKVFDQYLDVGQEQKVASRII
ncbi:MAG: oxygen-independent coproporphyrinogen III oxidase [Aestuariibacter sp.]